MERPLPVFYQVAILVAGTLPAGVSKTNSPQNTTSVK